MAPEVGGSRPPNRTISNFLKFLKIIAAISNPIWVIANACLCCASTVRFPRFQKPFG
ncbi:hypothetical protein AGR1A_Cc20295 [Agrobacterium fabacearum CFBP 5771]|nr:hypothetical protein AGR1B_Cc120317 [Agrobacterium fabacearum S56]CVI15184.1 hypothetical protein AGR1A_Cc20295 [Agrobacterium fabacearum CFBP 5771]